MSEPQENQYASCYVAYLDLLGFSHKVKESQEDLETLKILQDCVKICGSIPSGGKRVSLADGGERIINVQSRFFSDSILFFVKKSTEDLPHLLLMIRYLQDRLWEKGLCLRGCVTEGLMWWDNDQRFTLGPGLIDAHKAEEDICIFPRIMICEKVVSEINDLDAYPFGNKNYPLGHFIKRDADGVFFLDLLNPGILRKCGEGLITGEGNFYIGWLEQEISQYSVVKAGVQQLVGENLAIDNLTIPVRMKYEWLASYLETFRDDEGDFVE